MSQPNQNQKTPPKSPLPVLNQAQHPHSSPQLTDAHVKEVVMDTLIELNLIQRTLKKKAIKLE
jgi:hypothetical protein